MKGQSVGFVVIAVIIVVILCGLVVRRRVSHCFGFSLYLLSVLVHALIVLVVPGSNFDFGLWRAMQIVYTSLRHLMALELAFHTFAAFPVARRLARSFLWMMSVLVLAAPFMFGFNLANMETVSLKLLPSMNVCAIALFTGLGVLILWYRLPLDRMHKAIIVGIVPYLLVYSVLLKWLSDFLPEFLPQTRQSRAQYLDIADFINTSAWIVVTAFWAWVAWRPRHWRSQHALLSEVQD